MASSQPSVPSDDSISIVGMACRFPAAPDLATFWNLLLSDEDVVGFLPDVWSFDPTFFKISPREAVNLDPRQRIMLELAWEALEDAGVPPPRLAGSDSSVFIATLGGDLQVLAGQHPELVDDHFASNTAHSFVPNRISYAFDLKGPSVAVDTACSGSLVALHLASQNLRLRDTSLALVGGVNVILEPSSDRFYERAGLLSPDRRCKAFDAEANGIVRAEGAAVLVLKRTDDAVLAGDRIHAIIAGSAVNHGGQANGIMAPSRAAQEQLLNAAYRASGMSPGRVQYIEAHGTGTRIGDPIEAAAIATVLGRDRRPGQTCTVGSVKSNIGHLEPAAGLAGVIKVVLAMRHRLLPPTRHLHRVNPMISFDGRAVGVQDRVSKWPCDDQPLVAGVSSFGMGGTNAHVVLTEPPQFSSSPVGTHVRLLPISARSPDALDTLTRTYIDRLRSPEALNLDDATFTATVRRMHHDHRRVAVGATPQDLAYALEAELSGRTTKRAFRGVTPRSKPRIAFVFSGQGSQWTGMGLELLEHYDAFNATLHKVDRLFRGDGFSVIEEIRQRERDSRLQQTDIAQASVFGLQTALATQLMALGVHPHVVAGQSLGDLAAAHIAGALTLEDAVRVVSSRGKAMTHPAVGGATAFIALPRDEVERALVDWPGVAIAGDLSNHGSLVSGDVNTVDQMRHVLAGRGIFCRRLLDCGVALHSPRMATLRPHFVQELRDISPMDTSTPLLSSLVGGHTRGHELTAEFWAEHLERPFSFHSVARDLADRDIDVVIEISPHPLLGIAVDDVFTDREKKTTFVGVLERDAPSGESFSSALAKLHVAGVEIAWERLFRGRHQVIDLPHYPWQRQRLRPTAIADYRSETKGSVGSLHDALFETQWVPVRETAWQKDAAPSMSEHWVLFADGGGLGERVASYLQSAGCRTTIARQGQAFSVDDGGQNVEMRPEQLEDYERLLAVPGRRSTHIIHLWAIHAPDDHFHVERARVACTSATKLVSALTTTRSNARLWFVTKGAASIPGYHDRVALDQSPMCGVARTIAQEHPEFWGGLIDLSPIESGDPALDILSQTTAFSGDQVVAFRGGRKHVPRLVHTTLERTQNRDSDTTGAVLITGAFGGLGTELASWLVTRGFRRLVLMTRTALPPRAKWATLAHDAPHRKQIDTVIRLEQRGAEVALVIGDVGSAKTMGAMLRQVRRKNWRVQRVYHLSASLRDRLITNLSPCDTQDVLTSKALSAWLLHRAMTKQPVEFFVLFSSMASLFPRAGQAAYAAANGVLDALAHYRRRQGLHALAINWGPWAQTGMSARLGIDQDFLAAGVGSIQLAEGFELLEQALHSTTPAQLAVFPADRRRFAEHLSSRSARLQLLGDDDQSSGNPNAAVRPRDTRVSTTQTESLEERLIALTAEVIHADRTQINPLTSIQDFGLDSIMLSELRAATERTFSVSIPLSDWLAGPTIRELTERISKAAPNQVTTVTNEHGHVDVR